MSGGGITADAFGEVDGAIGIGIGGAGGIGGGGGIDGVEPFEELLDAAMSEPESGLELEDGFPDDGEAEVAGFDDAGVDGTHGDLVDPGAFHREEGIGLGVGEGRVRSGAPAHRVPTRGPVCVPDQSAGQRVVDGHDPEQVMHLAFEA